MPKEMEFRTRVELPEYDFTVSPGSRLLFAGSCFADNIGSRFGRSRFHAVVNPYGTMYNPVSVLHTIERTMAQTDFVPDIVFLTLGTNHVYRLKETGEIVDNCMKRPQSLFIEECLSIDDCAAALSQVVAMVSERNPQVKVIITVSPIRYAKYGYHGSQLSKSILLLAADRVVASHSCCHYFPAYEIVNDELRDYRFYSADMLHPSDVAVDYLWQQIARNLFSAEAHAYVAAISKVVKALEHKPYNPDSQDYADFLNRTRSQIHTLADAYPHLRITMAEFF